ncbi:unnamed protein product [Toxocara canis]|uniref:Pep3/Vps18 beta-propeller domain-containing protein n=1 Tax=Toxocara canis TaxID=6265 RepID=A0A3P7FIX6_TOXCA|nr:unnamed protein product [Toxocara canis]
MIETQIQSDGNLLYSKELVRNLSGEKDMPITDIELVQCSEEGDKQRWAVFICTPGRLYSVAGSVDRKTDRSMVQPVVGAIWNSTFMEEATGALQSLFSFKDPPRYHCMDDSQRTLPSAFVLYPKSSSGIPASKFCWIGVNGYTIGRIDINHTDPYSMLIEDAHIFKKYARGTILAGKEGKVVQAVERSGPPEASPLGRHRLVDGRYDYPLDSALTEYHVLLLYSDRLEAVSLLNQKCMFQDARGSIDNLGISAAERNVSRPDIRVGLGVY